MKICIFGDSITWGAFDSEGGGWATRLRNHFESRGIYIYNCGVCGDTTEDLLKRFGVEVEAREPSLIIFAIGINDSRYIDTEDNPEVEIEKFEDNLEKLLSLARKHTDKIVFIGLTRVVEEMTTPREKRPENYYENKIITRYDKKIAEFCEKEGLPYIKMGNVLDDDDLSDGLHPNTAGHIKMYERVKSYLIDRGSLS